MRIRSLLAAVVVSLAAAPVAAQNRPDMSGARMDRAAIESAARIYETAWADADARAIAAMYSTNAMLLGSGDPANGRDDIQRTMADGFAGAWKGTKLRIAPEPVEFVRNDVAIGYGRYTIVRGSETLAEGKYLNLWVKQGGKWYIRANQAMVPAPQK
jgi:uncharacterized protein (TIGR02246 family)